jgi:uncharacterized protein with von Willebrand factor type A (vWA) domain
MGYLLKKKFVVKEADSELRMAAPIHQERKEEFYCKIEFRAAKTPFFCPAKKKLKWMT